MAEKIWTHAKFPFTCPVTFKPGSYSRSKANVATQPYLVVESDILDRDEVGAIFRWLREKIGMRLVAVVDTGGKSLHAWFRYPKPNAVDKLKLALVALSCDPAMFVSSQPVRLAGALRKESGRMQSFLYLDSKEAAL